MVIQFIWLGKSISFRLVGWQVGQTEMRRRLRGKGKWSDLMCPIHEIQKHDISKQTSKPINNSVHCFILALSYSCSRANNECYLCELCEAPRALCVFLALSNNANIYWNYPNFLLDTNQFLSCSRAEAERKLLTQTYTFDALSPHCLCIKRTYISANACYCSLI